MIRVKRIYEKPHKADGTRVLVDRLWPRGLSKNDADIDYWMKEFAPSDGLRKWFSHKEERWLEFRAKYFKELRKNEESIKRLKAMAKKDSITFLFGAKDKKNNNAVALCEFLKKMK